MPKPDPIAERTARLKAARLARERYYPPATHAYPVHGLLDALPFGKHRGKVLRDVIDEDHGWVVWALENVRDFEISDEAQAELDLALDVRRPPKAWQS